MNQKILKTGKYKSRATIKKCIIKCMYFKEKGSVIKINIELVQSAQCTRRIGAKYDVLSMISS